MRMIIILVGLTVLLAGCATSKKVNIASTVERAGVVYKINDVEPFTGRVTAYYLSGRPKSRAEYRCGLKDGEQIEWRENGPRREITTWRNGLRDGAQLQWYENGQKLFEGWMRQGKWCGLCQGGYPNGRQAFQICFQDGQGKGQTIVVKWNNNNLVREFPDVLIDGEWIEWHLSGQMTRREKYQNGRLIEKIQ